MADRTKRATNADLLEVLERIESLMLLIQQQLLFDRFSQPYVSPAPSTNGYRCGFCGMWVYGGYHSCMGKITVGDSPNQCGSSSPPPNTYTVWNGCSSTCTGVQSLQEAAC